MHGNGRYGHYKGSDFLMEIEKCKQWFENGRIFGKCSNFWKMFEFSENVKIFGKCSDFQKRFRFSENVQIFGKCSDFRKMFRF